MKKVFLEFCADEKSSKGKAIYLSIEDSEGNGHGYRIIGEKCYGFINVLKKWEIDEQELLELIKQSKLFLKEKRKKF